MFARLAGHGLDLVGFWRASTEALASAVPHDFAPCWFTLDPASLLVTSHFDEGVPELPPQWLIHEYYEDDVNKLADVARSKRGISTLHEATGGDPTSSPRWHFNMALGGDQELIAALRALESRRADSTDRRTLHELVIHNEQLAAQHEQLLEAQHAVERSRQEFEELFDFCPLPYVVFDAHGGFYFTDHGITTIERVITDPNKMEWTDGTIETHLPAGVRTKLLWAAAASGEKPNALAMSA